MLSAAPGVIERAFQLAEDCANVEQIRSRLRKEGYSSVDAHLMGRKIRADLVRIMRREVQGQERHASITGRPADVKAAG